MRTRGEGVGGADDLRHVVVAQVETNLKGTFEKPILIQNFIYLKPDFFLKTRVKRVRSLFNAPNHVGSKGKLRRVVPVEQGPVAASVRGRMF